MENKDLIITQDWEETEGALRWQNAKTIERYKELTKASTEYDTEKSEIFFAFTNAQFDEAVKRLRLEGKKIYRVGGLSGGFGTDEGIRRYYAFLAECDRKITEECVPQEVYCYEFNNHECMISWEGDKGAIMAVAYYWGWEAARRIERRCAYHSIDALIRETEERRAAEAAKNNNN